MMMTERFIFFLLANIYGALMYFMACCFISGHTYHIIFQIDLDFHFIDPIPPFFCRPSNPFWDSKPELFSDIACLRIPYQPCIVLFGNFFSCTPATNRHELCLHLNVVPTAAGVFKSRHILLHKYVNRIMITYL